MAKDKTKSKAFLVVRQVFSFRYRQNAEKDHFKNNCNTYPIKDGTVMTFFQKSFATFAKLSRTARHLKSVEGRLNTFFLFKIWSAFRKTMSQLQKTYRSRDIRAQS